MSATPADHFTPLAKQYAAFRPTYPAALFDWLASVAPAHELAWDCGAGSGQATLPLAQRFRQVLASDLSAAQLAAAPAPDNVTCRVAPAHDSGLPPHSVDLIIVAQALHWFDLDRFYAEARRVLKPHGLLAVWGYNRLHIGQADIQGLLEVFYSDTLGAYWPSERAHVESGYRDLPFPFFRLPAPDFAMQQTWQLPQLLGYLRSWSAVGRYQTATGHDPMAAFEQTIAPHWPKSEALKIDWPLFLQVGRDMR